MSIHLQITVKGPTEAEDRSFTLNMANLLTSNASQREAEAAYLMALLRGFQQRARQLTDLGAEGWARTARNDERQGIGQ